MFFLCLYIYLYNRMNITDLLECTVFEHMNIVFPKLHKFVLYNNCLNI